MIKSKPFIVMDSPSCAIELETKYGLKGKVFVVPPVVTFSTRPIMNKKKQIIVVNTLEPRKRTQNAINGFIYAKNAKILDSEWKLIVVGGHGWLEEKLEEDLKVKKFGNALHILTRQLIHLWVNFTMNLQFSFQCRQLKDSDYLL